MDATFSSHPVLQNVIVFKASNSDMSMNEMTNILGTHIKATLKIIW